MNLYGAGRELLGAPDKRRPVSAFTAWLTPLLSILTVSCSSAFWEEGATFLYETTTGAGTSYLLGTTHVGVSFDELPDHVRSRLDAVSAVGFETSPSAPISNDELFELGLIARGETILSNRLPAEVWPKLVAAMASRTDELRLQRFRPWLARFVLGLTFIDGLPRLENEIESAPEAAGKSFFELETQRAQLEVLASIPEDEVIEALILMASDPEGARRELDLTFEAYRRADAPFFERTFLEPADSGEVELLIRARNRRWIEPIATQFERERSFLAVGAAHLVGPEGLLVLLEERGLVLTPTSAP